MKTQLKVLSVLAAALAVVFSTASVSMAFSTPGELANCRKIDSGLSFVCDPVSNLTVVNSSVIPVTGIGLPSSTTSLRSINDPAFATDDLSLSDSALALSAAPATNGLSLSDFALTLPEGVPVLTLSDFAISAIGLDNFSLSDFALTLPVIPVVSLSDFAIASAGLENLSLSDFAISAINLENLSLSDFAMAYQDSVVKDDNLLLMDDYTTGPMYGSGYYY